MQSDSKIGIELIKKGCNNQNTEHQIVHANQECIGNVLMVPSKHIHIHRECNVPAYSFTKHGLSIDRGLYHLFFLMLLLCLC